MHFIYWESLDEEKQNIRIVTVRWSNTRLCWVFTVFQKLNHIFPQCLKGRLRILDIGPHFVCFRCLQTLFQRKHPRQHISNARPSVNVDEIILEMKPTLHLTDLCLTDTVAAEKVVTQNTIIHAMQVLFRKSLSIHFNSLVKWFPKFVYIKNKQIYQYIFKYNA